MMDTFKKIKVGLGKILLGGVLALPFIGLKADDFSIVRIQPDSNAVVGGSTPYVIRDIEGNDGSGDDETWSVHDNYDPSSFSQTLRLFTNLLLPSFNKSKAIEGERAVCISFVNVFMFF